MDEKRVIKTVKKVMPAVVSIVIAKRLEDLEREMPIGHYPFIPGHPNVKRERSERDQNARRHGGRTTYG